MVHAGIEENLTVLSYLFPLKFRTANFGKWWNDFSTNQSTTHIFKLKWSSNMMSALTLSKCNSVALIANRIFRRLKLQTIERICATEDLKISAVVQHRQINKKKWGLHASSKSHLSVRLLFCLALKSLKWFLHFAVLAIPRVARHDRIFK